MHGTGTIRPFLRSSCRIAGLVYLVYFLTAVAGGICLRGMTDSARVTVTLEQLALHRPLFQAGLSLSLVATCLYLALAALFYDLFKPVDRALSTLAVLFGIVGCALQAASYVFCLVFLDTLAAENPGTAIALPNQSPAAALMILRLATRAPDVYLVFFGVYCVLLGLLARKAIFMPKRLGSALIIAGAGWIAYLVPPIASHLSPYILPFGFLAEAWLMACLLSKSEP